MLRALVILACLVLSIAPVDAMVGDAQPAPDGVGRHAVVIVGSRGTFCTGVALARDLVLTAAHCALDGALYKLVDYGAGKQPLLRDVVNVVRHPQFDVRSLLAHRATADVALLKLAAPIAVLPAPLDTAEATVAVGDPFTVAGAGVAVRTDGKSGGTVRVATLVATGRPGNLQLRLVDPKTKGAWPGLGACTGDSGAPVFRDSGGRAVIIGVVSWSTGPGTSAGCGGLTGVTPLSLYRTWIMETAAKLGSPLR